MNGAYQMSVRCLSCPPEQGRLVHQAVGVPTMGRTETCATAVCVACGTDYLLRVQLTATSGRSNTRVARLARETSS